MFKYLVVFGIQLSTLLSTTSYAMFSKSDKQHFNEMREEFSRIKINAREKVHQCEKLLHDVDRELTRTTAINDRTIKVFREIEEDLNIQINAWKESTTVDDPLIVDLSSKDLLNKALHYGYFIEELDYLSEDLIVYSTTATFLAFYYSKKTTELISRLKPFYEKKD